MGMDPLVKLPLKQWPKLQQKLKRLWPLNMAGYYALYFNMAYPRVRDAFQFKVYCPYGDMDNGFVAKSFKATTECIIFPTTKDTSKLEEALINTRRIDWKKGVQLSKIPSTILPVIDNIKSSIGFSNYEVNKIKMLLVDRRNAPFKDIRYPENTYMAPVTRNHMKLIDDSWPHRHANSFFYFSTLASNGLSYGLYSSHTHELLAWLFICEYNVIRHMYCKEGYRRKGYMEFLMKFVSNDQLKKGNDVYGYVDMDNKKPMTMLLKGIGAVEIDIGAIINVKVNELTQQSMVGGK